MRILEEFWYCNIELTEYASATWKELKEALHLLDYQKRGKTSGNHDGRAEGTFFRYTDAVHEHQTMVECLLFQSSFKLGAKMMVEVME